MESKKITVQVEVRAPIEKAWLFWTEPSHIVQWNFASDDWECPWAKNDLRVGGKFSAAMNAKDKSAGFEFGGTYFKVEKFKEIAYRMNDGRTVQVKFESTPNKTNVTETFDLESTHSEEQQRSGWQAILANFKKHVEGHA